MVAKGLTPSQEVRLRALRRVATLLDSAAAVPGTSFRIGLDPILGLIPGIGDLISPAFTAAILIHAWDVRVPKVVQLRMLLNAGVDALVGAIPFIGDLFDFAWKANQRNLMLLEQHAFEGRRTSAGDWLFAAMAVVVVIGFAALPLLVMAWLISLLRGWF